MIHYMPEEVDAYIDEGCEIKEVTIKESLRHGFILSAVINGELYRFNVKHKSTLAIEIIDKGRNKMSVDDMKELVKRLLLPQVINK